jgi:putative transposase
MHRKTCRRINEPGDAHELTFSCYQRLPLLSRDRSRRWLVDAIESARQTLLFDLWAYVFRPEHVHLMVRPREREYKMSRLLWHIKRPVGRRAIKYLEEHAPGWLSRLSIVRVDGTIERRFWQVGGGYDRNVVEDSTLYSMIDYIHMNPVRRGLADRPEDWEWSSARWYAGIRPVPIEIDRTLPRTYDV